jgi:sarcosine oxidase
MVKITQSSSTKDEIENPDYLNRNTEPEELSIISGRIQDYLPDLFPDPVRVSVYMDGYTNDNQFLVGKLPGEENIVLLSGFSGHGFKLAPIMGKIASEILLEGRTQYPIDHLSPSRFITLKVQ